jgi:hypothetical protein
MIFFKSQRGISLLRIGTTVVTSRPRMSVERVRALLVAKQERRARAKLGKRNDCLA